MAIAKSTQVAKLMASLAAVALRSKVKKPPIKKKGSGRTRRTRAPFRARSTALYRGAVSRVRMTKRRRTVKENHSSEMTSTSLNVPARRASAKTLAMVSLEPQWFRVQGLTQFDSGKGFYALAQRSVSAGTYANHVILPMHVWDITSCPNISSGGGMQWPQVGFWTAFTNTTGTADAVVGNLSSQNSTGDTSPAYAAWRSENISGSENVVGPLRKAYHEYTLIKANLYGNKVRPTRFVAQLIMLKDVFGDFIGGGSANMAKKKLFDYMTRPFMYTNLNSGDPQSAVDVKVLKTFEVVVPPLKTDDYAGFVQVHTLNWFIRHNRVRRFDWFRPDVPGHANDASFDVDTVGHDTRVDPKARVYFVIRALSPTRSTVDTPIADPNPFDEPSYDLVIRNKWAFPQ